MDNVSYVTEADYQKCQDLIARRKKLISAYKTAKIKIGNNLERKIELERNHKIYLAELQKEWDAIQSLPVERKSVSAQLDKIFSI